MTRASFLPFVLTVAAGCSDAGNSGTHQFTRFSMGTVVDYTVAAPSAHEARAVVDSAHREMERISHLLWEDDSLSVIHRLNESQAGLDVADEVARFLRRARSLVEESGGAFDPTIKPVLDLYAFDEDEPRPPTQDALARSLESVGYAGLTVHDDGRVSKETAATAVAVGGFAKGYAVDRAVAVLAGAGIRSAIVNAGGDMFCLGTAGGEPWRVGVRDPDEAEEILLVLNVADAAVATSGDYQQFFEYDGVRYHHILDPRDGQPARGVRSATVVTTTAERADALATALFVLGADEGLKWLDGIPDAEGLVVDLDGSLRFTEGMRTYVASGIRATPSGG